MGTGAQNVIKGAQFNGRISVSKTADKGSIPLAPARKNVDNQRKKVGKHEKNNRFYKIGTQ